MAAARAHSAAEQECVYSFHECFGAPGIIAALLAALAWSLNFIVPFVIGDYSIFDIALFRFLISGVLASAYLIVKRRDVRGLAPRDWLVCFALGVVGYLMYFQALAAAALYAGPVVAPAFLALVPVILGIAGNLKEPAVAWRDLAFPFTLATVGLVLVNVGGFERSGVQAASSPLLGMSLGVLAAACWVTFGVVNQSALATRPHMQAGIWTALIMTGASLGMLAFIPIGIALHAFAATDLGLGWDRAASLYLWGTVLALTASLGGALAWTFASQRLPVALAAQLITMETVFGTALGLMMRHRWPSLMEGLGMLVLLAGVIITIRMIHGRQHPVTAAVGSSF